MESEKKSTGFSIVRFLYLGSVDGIGGLKVSGLKQSFCQGVRDRETVCDLAVTKVWAGYANKHKNRICAGFQEPSARKLPGARAEHAADPRASAPSCCCRTIRIPPIPVNILTH